MLWNIDCNSLLMRLGESQALKSCLNIGKPSVLGVFHLPHSFLLPSLRHLAFWCWRLICMDNINRAATTSGFLSAISQCEPCLARDKRKKSEVRIFIFLTPSVQGCLRQTFHSVESYSSYQVSLREFGHTYKHRKPPSQNQDKKFLMPRLLSITPFWPQEITVLFFDTMD